MSMYTGKYLTIQDNLINEETEIEIIQNEYQGLDTQKWILKDSQINGWEIVSFINPELAITIDGDIQNGSKLTIAQNENTNNQMFYIFNITDENKTKTDGIYKIALGKDSSKALNIFNSDNNDNEIVNLLNYRK